VYVPLLSSYTPGELVPEISVSFVFVKKIAPLAEANNTQKINKKDTGCLSILMFLTPLAEVTP